MSHSPNRNWIPALLALILIFPLFSLPRPINVSSIPWKVELLFSAFLLLSIFIVYRDRHSLPGQNDVWEYRERTVMLFCMIGFCVWSILSCLWANSTASAIHHSLVWASYAIVFAFAFTVTLVPRGKSLITLTFCLIAVLVGALAVFDFLTIQDFSIQEGTLRIRYAKFAEMLVLVAPLLFSAAIIVKDRSKFAVLLAIGSAGWIAVMLSLSKGAFLAGSIGFVLLFSTLMIFKRGLTRKTLAAASVWIALTVVFQFGISELTSIPSTVNYISGERGASRSTSDMRIYTWKVAGEMIASNSILGVGGDNFGVMFNGSREALALANPQDPDSAIGEDYVFERAHNEPVQILAELGIIGIGLFASFVFVIAWFLFRSMIHRGRRLSPLFFGGLAGIVAFAVSSLVSSFSFRAFQNGIVFFIVLGLTLAISRDRRNVSISTRRYFSVDIFAKTAVVAFPVLLLIFSLTKAASQYILLAGEGSRELETAVRYFDVAAGIDPDNPGAELASAEAYVREKRWDEAIPHFRRSIDRGFGVTLIYSYLANAEEMSGDLAAAEQTLDRASSVFPRSPFIRARLAIVLEKLGRPLDAQEQLKAGQAFDLRQTNGWYSVIKDGILNAHQRSQDDRSTFAAPPELLPYNAIHAYNTDKIRVD